MSDSKKEAKKDELSMAMESMTMFMSMCKPVLVACIAAAEHASLSIKNAAMTGTLTKYTEEQLFSPFAAVQRNLDGHMYTHSEALNTNHKQISSLARSHQAQFVASTSIGFGLLSAMPIRAFKLPGGGKVFKTVTMLALPTTYAFTHLIQYKWNNPRSEENA